MTSSFDLLSRALFFWPLDLEQRNFVRKAMSAINEDEARRMLDLVLEAESAVIRCANSLEGGIESEQTTYTRQQPERVTPETTLASRQALEEALRLDPNWAEAWSELAYVLIIDFFRGWNDANNEVVEAAKQAVDKAYAIDRSIALTHLAEGKIREIEGDFLGEVDALDEALRLDPNLLVAYAHKANAMILLGRVQEAPALLEKAIALSPRDPDIGLFYWFMGRAYFVMKDYNNAIQWLEASAQERPTTWFTWAYLISAYALTGRLRNNEAQAALNEYRAKFQNWPLNPTIKDYYTQGRYRNAAPDLMASLQEFFNGLQTAQGMAGFP
jgi:tetratricopeptide (TPR) repeat protein